MLPSRWSQFALVLSIATLILIFMLWASRSAETPDFSEASRQLDLHFSARLHAVSDAYKSGNAVAHLQATATALRLMNRTSIRALLPQVDSLVEAIAKDGPTPYVSIAMEFAHRLGRIDHPKMQRKFTELAKATLAPADKDKRSMTAASRMVGLIRSEGAVSYRQYDYDTTFAVSQLVFSEFGRSQFLRGQTLSDLVRTTVMLWECQNDEPREAPRNEKAKAACRDFLDRVSRKLSDSEQGGLLPAAMGALAGGTRMHTFSCLRGDLSGQEFIEAVEAYSACMSNKERRPSGLTMDGASVVRYYDGPAPELPGYKHTHAAEFVAYGPNGNTGTQVVHQYKNDSGGRATVTIYSMTVNGQESSGTHIVTNDGAGNTHEQHQNAQGDITSSFTQHSDGSTDTFQQNADGSTYVVTTTSDGTTQITVTDSKGNVTTATIKENGDCTGAACSASMPNPDEPGATDGCSLRAANSRRTDPESVADPLGPLIYPSPDSPSASPLLACLASSIGTRNGGRRCPPSVALCLEPPPLFGCGCGKEPHGRPPDPKAGACNRIQCPEGNACDPGTGACRSYSPGGGLFGAFSPGVKPPPPGPVLRLPRP